MKAVHRITQGLALLALSALNAQLSIAQAQGTAFSYQGRLNDTANPANGIYDLRFAIYDAAANGNAVGGVVTNAATPISNGLFTVTLDFGPEVFTGPPRWLEVGVRTNGGAGFTGLTPRQAILPAPYALMANTASTLPAGTLTNAQTNATLAGTFSGVFYGNGAGISNLPPSSAAIFNVKRYGTNVGAGDATIDSTAILAAYNAWVASPVGGILYFPAGTYRDNNTYVYDRGLGNPASEIKGDGMYNTVWMGYRITNATFFYGAVNVSDIGFVASPFASGFNVAFKNDKSAWGMRLDKVLFQGWGVGWYTDCAGANGLSLHFNNCTIGLKLVGFADGGFFTGRLEHCVVGAEIGGTDLGSANPAYSNGATHANRLHFEGPSNTYVYVVGDGAVCTLGGYFEEVRDVVAIGFPPDVVSLVPGITETNKGTWSVTIDSLGGFGGSTAGHNAQSVVSIYTPALYGLAIRNSMFSALDLVRSTTAQGDSTPIVIENSLPSLITTDGTRPFPRVITYSDGTCIPAWNGERPLNAEINSQKRHYVGTNLVNDLSLGNNQLYNTVIGQTDLGFATTPDPDSVNFCASAAITDAPTRAAVSKLCKDLKQAKLWSKFYLLYPFANATPLGCSVNLMTNASTYTISWYGTNSSTFTPLGVVGDGSATYGDTHFIPWWIPGANALDMAFFVYNETASLPSSSRGTFIGVKGTFKAGLDYYNAGSGVAILADGFMTTGTSSVYGVMNSDYRGLLMTQRTSSETGTLLVNWLTMPYYDYSPNSGSIGLPGNSVYILAKNDGGGLSQPAAATLAMAGISHSFTIGDWNAFRVICDNYNALLGRKAP